MGLLFSCCKKKKKKSSSYLVNFFNSRSYSDLSRAFEEDCEFTMNLLFAMRRDYEFKDNYRIFIRHLANDYPDFMMGYLPLIPLHGTYKDLLFLFGTKLEDVMIKRYCLDLKRSLYPGWILDGTEIAAKYAPSEKCHFDKKYGAVSKFCNILGWTKRDYRLNIVKLRSNLNLVESHIGKDTLSEIVVGKISRHALRVNKEKILLAKQKQKYKKLNSVEKEKILWKDLEEYAKRVLYERIMGITQRVPSKSLQERWSKLKMAATVEYRHSWCITESFLKSEKEVYPLQYIVPQYISYRSCHLDEIFYYKLPVFNNTEDVSRYLVENWDGTKDRIFLFLNGNAKTVFENIENPTIADLIFWTIPEDHRSSCGLTFISKGSKHYICGFSIVLLYFLTNSEKISASRYIKFLCNLYILS
ncbi:MAG TPA: hypothetical protein PKD85_00575 [Saprospiraceae bacterium]|nr:hypothetical protein [Saprospiraceae bacterium]